MINDILLLHDICEAEYEYSEDENEENQYGDDASDCDSDIIDGGYNGEDYEMESVEEMDLEVKKELKSAFCEKDNCELDEEQVNIKTWNGADLESDIITVLKLEQTECFYPWANLCVNDKCEYDEDETITKYQGESLQDDI